MLNLFEESSLVDFLTFCFGLNTMFSFSRVRKRFLFNLQRDLREKLRIIELSEEDCKIRADALLVENNESSLACLELQKCTTKFEDTIVFHRNLLDKFSCLFQRCFSAFAFLTGVIIVFSGSDFIKQRYYWTLLLLLPTVLFLLFWSFYPVAIYVSKEKLYKIAKQHLITLDIGRSIMNEISKSLKAQSGNTSKSGKSRTSGKTGKSSKK